MERLVGPYFEAVAEWYEALAVGVPGGALQAVIERRLGDPFFGIFINPGHQAVWVWKDARILGKAAGEAAIALAGGAALDQAVPGIIDFVSPNGTTLTSWFAELDVLTQENLQNAVERGKITQEELCAGVTAGSIPACP